MIDELLKGKLTESKIAKQGLEEMKLLLRYCSLYGCGDVVSFDLSLARGLDYYTGVTFTSNKGGIYCNSKVDDMKDLGYEEANTIHEYVQKYQFDT